MKYYCFLLNIKKRKYGENVSEDKEKLKKIITVIRHTNRFVHKQVSDAVFQEINPVLIRQVAERYEQKKWDFFFGNSSNHITVFRVQNRGKKESLLIVKTTRDFEQKILMTTTQEFFPYSSYRIPYSIPDFYLFHNNGGV